MKSVGTSNLGTIFLIVNAALGAGLLNFPKAFDQAGGIEVALIVQTILVIFVIASLFILAKCSDVNGAGTVQVEFLNACIIVYIDLHLLSLHRQLFMEQVEKLVSTLVPSV